MEKLTGHFFDDKIDLLVRDKRERGVLVSKKTKCSALCQFDLI